MSHFTVMVALKADNPAHALGQLENVLDRYDENKEMPARFQKVDPAEAVAFYRKHPNLCSADQGGPSQPFDEYVKEGDLEAWHRWTAQAVGAYEHSDRNDGIYDANLDAYGVMTTYNPESKWDWWVLGGRWRGSLRMREGVKVVAEGDDLASLDPTVAIGAPPHWGETMGGGQPEDKTGYADLARKADIDVDTLRNDAVAQAVKTWEAYEKATEGLSPCKPFSSMVLDAYAGTGIDPEGWQGFVAGYDEGRTEEEAKAEIDRRRKEFNAPLDKARERFNNDPWVRALREVELMGFMSSPHEDFFVGHDDPQVLFVERARASALSTYAFVDLKGEWYQRGEMGWFGMSHDEKDPEDWGRALGILFDRLDDDTYVAMIDCHI